MTLARPEIVPFRLTPSMVDGMGLCGFEGVFRRVMETSMSVLRSNRETLLSVLEPFLQVGEARWEHGVPAAVTVMDEVSWKRLSMSDFQGKR